MKKIYYWDHPLKQSKAAIDTVALLINAVKIEFGRPELQTIQQLFPKGLITQTRACLSANIASTLIHRGGFSHHKIEKTFIHFWVQSI